MRRQLRGLIVLVICLALVAAGVLAGFGWYYSDELLNVTRDQAAPDLVASVSDGVITLPRTDETGRPGTYGIRWDGGSGIAGRIRTRTASTVTRSYHGDRLPAGTKVNLETDVWPDGDPDSSLGLPYTPVQVPDPLGGMPSWYVPATGHTWVVAVHGRGATPAETLRVLPTLHRLGLPVLAIAYRNDVGAPRSPDRLYHLGDTEWRDVEAGVRYAVRHGARRVVLYGWSMGGALIDAFLDRSPLADRVPAVVLDAPVLDWRATLALQADNRGAPGIVTDAAEQIVHWRIGIDWDDFDLEDHPADVDRPTLVFVGADDDSVPIRPAQQLAARNPRVSLVTVAGAGHTEAWNADPAGYDRRLADFLRRVTG